MNVKMSEGTFCRVEVHMYLCILLFIHVLFIYSLSTLTMSPIVLEGVTSFALTPT